MRNKAGLPEHRECASGAHNLSEVDARSDRRVGRLRIAGASAMMIEYNPAVGWQQQGGKGKQQTRYKAPGKGLRGPLSRAGGGGAGAPSGNAEHRHGPKATTHGLKSV